MKLKNKRTGEIIEFDAILPVKDVAGDSVAHLEYGSLAELNEEWEDAPEEPKEWWYIDIHGPHNVIKNDNYYQVVKEASKEIGNYFETKEEAEKAVEKLKAWKRLKDKGFRFLPEASFIQQKNEEGESIGSISFTMYDEDDYIWGNNKDLDLLFSGEDD